MEIKHQIFLIKSTYIFLLVLGFLYFFGDLKNGFMDGYHDEKPVILNSWFTILVLFTSAYLGLVVLYQLFKFINSVNDVTVFSEKNVKLIQKMGWNCMIQSILLYLFYLSKLDHINFESLRGVNFEFYLLIFGLTLITISFVFKKGIQLQQEQDLTI